MVKRKSIVVVCALALGLLSGCGDKAADKTTGAETVRTTEAVPKKTDSTTGTESTDASESTETTVATENTTTAGSTETAGDSTEGQIPADGELTDADLAAAEPITPGTASKGTNTEINLYKVKTAKEYIPLFAKGNIYGAQAGNKKLFVDSMINVTNIGQKEIEVKTMSSLFVATNGYRYDGSDPGAEDEPNLNTYDAKIEPGSTTLVHFGIEIPEGVTEGKVYINIDGKLYCYDYDANKDISCKTDITSGTEIKEDGFGSFKLTETKWTTKVLPPNSAGSHSYFEVSESNDVFYVVYCDFTNLTGSPVESEEFIHLIAKFDGKEEARPGIYLLNSEMDGYDIGGEIGSQETKSAIFLVEIPKTYQDKNVELEFYFNGNEYDYNE